MDNALRRSRSLATIGGIVATLALLLVPSALGDDWARDRSAADAVQQQLDPAIRTALAARSVESTGTATPRPAVVSTAAAGGDEFAWGAAAVGLGAGVAAMCLLLGCVTLVRSHGRLRSV